MESQARIRTRAGWQASETDQLFAAVRQASAEGVPLRAVFERLSADLGRKPNSIRNYYYACLRQQPQSVPRTPAFEPFTPEETHRMLREILIGRGEGLSVRACVMRMSGGSQSRMLRYQNKYRTLLRHRPEMIAQVAEELRQEGLPCPAPEPPRTEQADAAFCDPEDAAAARLMAQPCVHHLLEGLKELLRRAARAEESADLQRALDRQQVQHDLLRIAWAKDYDACAACLRQTTDALQSLLAPGDADPQSLRPIAQEALDASRRLLEAHTPPLH